MKSVGLATAKAKLSEIVAKARTEGPQEITIHGKPAAVIVSAEEWESRIRPKENMVEFFMNSPFRKYRVPITRIRGKLRDVEF